MKKIYILLVILNIVSCSTVIEDILEKNFTGDQPASPAKEEVKPEPVAKEKVYIDRDFVKVKNTPKVKKFCRKISKKFLHWGWGHSRCDSFSWHHVRDSYLGDPLMWVTYGDEEEHKEKPKNVTMIMCGVHGDEITPIKFCFDVLHYLYKLEPNTDEHKNFKDNLIVVAPIANPDSFFRKRPSRTNYRGVDINRNFPTKDWNSRALKLWKSWYRKDKRRFPGHKPLSEPETYFQVNLIKRYQPNRIISVHAPLTILDYDGPSVTNKEHGHHEVALSAKHLLVQMSKKAKDYRIKNYPFFPGSLGNYAGNERNIPTYTLELPTSDNRKHKEYWDKFRNSIDYAMFSSHKNDSLVSSESGKSSKESTEKSNSKN